MRIKPHWQILGALALAAILGTLLGGMAYSEGGGSAFADGALGFLEFLGDLFISALKMMIVPLVMTSIIAGIAGLGKIEGFGRLGAKTIGYYALSSVVAIVIGLVFVNVFKPGLVDGQPNEVLQARFAGEEAIAEAGESSKVAAAALRAEGGLGNLVSVFKSMFPSNLVAAASTGNLLGLIVFSLLFAAALVKLPDEYSEPVTKFVIGFNETIVMITRWIIALAPIGVLGLVAPVVAEMGSAWDLIQALGKYFLVVLLALGIHFGVALPIILKLLGGISPRAHYAAMRQAILTAFSTASSSATLPVTIRNLRDNAGTSRRVTSFVLPLGATVNMDGTALYECVAVIFVAQVLGWDMPASQQFMVVFLALLTSIGVAGIPSASLVAILIIMNSVGIPNPEAAMGVLLAVDRVLDMCRTSVNVFSDSCGAAIIAASEGEELHVASGAGEAKAG